MRLIDRSLYQWILTNKLSIYSQAPSSTSWIVFTSLVCFSSNFTVHVVLAIIAFISLCRVMKWNVGDRKFPVAAAHLPHHVILASYLPIFTSRLKTYLYSLSFRDYKMSTLWLLSFWTFAPYGLRSGNAAWFICWFRRNINCLFVYLTTFLTSFLMLSSLRS